jgi:hypothetical protein
MAAPVLRTRYNICCARGPAYTSKFIDIVTLCERHIAEYLRIPPSISFTTLLVNFMVLCTTNGRVYRYQLLRICNYSSTQDSIAVINHKLITKTIPSILQSLDILCKDEQSTQRFSEQWKFSVQIIHSRHSRWRSMISDEDVVIAQYTAEYAPEQHFLPFRFVRI